MNLLLDLGNKPIAQQIGWVLLHSLWQGALIGGMFELARFTLRNRSANARYVAGCCGLALMIASPIATLFVMQGPVSSPAQATSILKADLGTYQAAAIQKQTVRQASEAGSISILQTRTANFLDQLAPWLGPLWLAGVMFFSFKLTQGWWQVGKIRAGGNEPLDSACRSKLDELRRRLGISRPVRLVQSALVQVPTVIGWLRPMILLPAASVTGLTPAQLEAILAHELAHVRRFDHLVNTFQCVVETLMFYHPVTWWISRCVREERENCCDDLVVEVCGNRIAYARALATLEEFRAAIPQVAFAASGGSLLNRVRRLLGVADTQQQTTARQFSGLALIGVGLVLIGLGIYTNAQPRMYRAAAIVRVDREPAARVENSNEEIRILLNPNTSAPDIAEVKSAVVLNQVAKQLDLAKSRSGPDGKEREPAQILAVLAKKIVIHPASASSHFEIRVFDEDPVQASKIANAVAVTYKQVVMQRAQEKTGLAALEERWKKQDDEVRAAQKAVDELREKLGIADMDPTNMMPIPTFSAEALRQLQMQSILLKDKEISEAKQLEHLKMLDPLQLREAVQNVVTDNNLGTLHTELDSAEQHLREVEISYNTNHLVYKSARKHVDDLTEKIDKRVQGILLGLANGLEATQARVAALDERIESAKSNDLRMAKLTRPYYEAKRELADKIQFNQILAMKIASEKTDLALPQISPITILEAAIPPEHPVSPNRTRGFALGFLGVVFACVGFLMLKEKRIPPTSQPA